MFSLQFRTIQTKYSITNLSGSCAVLDLSVTNGFGQFYTAMIDLTVVDKLNRLFV